VANESHEFAYSTHLDIYYPPLQIVDVPALVAACTHRWYNQTLCRVNDSVVRLGVVQGDYHWHKRRRRRVLLRNKRSVSDRSRRPHSRTGTWTGVGCPERCAASAARAGEDGDPDGRRRRHRANRRRLTRASEQQSSISRCRSKKEIIRHALRSRVLSPSLH